MPHPRPAVCLLTSGHDPYDDRIFYKEALSLRKAGFAVTIIAPTASCDEASEGILIRRLRMSRTIGHSRLRVIERVGRFIWAGMGHRAQVYHCHEWDAVIAGYVIRFLKRWTYGQRVKVVNEIRDSFPGVWPSGERRSRLTSLKTSLCTFLDKVVNCRADYVIAVEEPKADRCVAFGFPRERTMPVENYAPLELFPFNPKRFDRDNLVLGYAGSVSAQRGIYVLAQASAEIGRRTGRRPKFLLLGHFRSAAEHKAFVEFCRRDAKLFDLEMEWVPHPEVGKRLSEADICFALFYDSPRYEWVLSGKAGPLKLYEYMACGKPVIAVDYRALKETIQREDCGLIVPARGGVAEVVKAIEHYLLNPEEMLRHGKNGRQAVERQYNWSEGEKKLLCVYHKLLRAGKTNRECSIGQD